MPVLYDKENRVISQSGETAWSKMLYVPQGKVAVLSVWGLTGNASIVEENGKKYVELSGCISVNKVRFSETETISRRLACDESVDFTAELLKQLNGRTRTIEPVITCGEEWTIDDCNNIVVIPVSGTYILELDDASQFDDVIIDYWFEDTADALPIPDNLKFGS